MPSDNGDLTRNQTGKVSPTSPGGEVPASPGGEVPASPGGEVRTSPGGGVRTRRAVFSPLVLGTAAGAVFVLGGAAVLLLGGAIGASGAIAAHSAQGVLPTGASGTSGVSGASGASGTSGTTGTSSASGASGTSGTSGVTGTTRTRVLKLPPATVVNGTAGIEVEFNGAPSATGATPALHPSVAGTWSVVGDDEKFTPASTLTPCGSYQLAIAKDTAVGGDKPLGKRLAASFTVACPSVTALQEALARLNYLPYKLEAFSGIDLNVPLTTALAAQRAYTLPHGYMRAAYRKVPPLRLGTMDPTTTGALEIWDQDHDIADGTAPNAELWTKLLAEEAHNVRNPRPYTWVTVTEQTDPEWLEVHENKRIVIKTLANTGVPGATTQTGDFPIYVRYVTTTMTGTNVDGTKYDDPGIPWVNYFNGGDAVHGYPRASYGFPQSNGCVELPIPTAERVYYQLAVGDMVDVEG